MKTKQTFSSIVLLALSGGILWSAPLGTAFIYQGCLNVGGDTAAGSYDLRFILYSADIGGNQVGPILATNAVAVSKGLFSVVLDFGGVCDGDARWLEIGVRTNGGGTFTKLAPRQPLTPSPYSLFASTAGNAQSVANGVYTTGAYANPTWLTALAGTKVTGNINGNAVGFTGSLAGNVSGTQGATVVGNVGGQPAANVASATIAANAATSSNIPNTIVTRDGGGNFMAGTVTATSFNGSGAGLTGIGLLRTTVLSLNAIGGVNYSTSYVKLGDAGTFAKLSSGSTIEITFHGRIGVSTQTTGTGAIFEMRVDNAATSNGHARALIKYTEAGWAGVNASITGIFTSLAAGSHTISFWVQGVGGSGTSAVVAGGNFSTDHIVIKELK